MIKNIEFGNMIGEGNMISRPMSFEVEIIHKGRKYYSNMAVTLKSYTRDLCYEYDLRYDTTLRNNYVAIIDCDKFFKNKVIFVNDLLQILYVVYHQYNANTSVKSRVELDCMNGNTATISLDFQECFFGLSDIKSTKIDILSRKKNSAYSEYHTLLIDMKDIFDVTGYLEVFSTSV